MSEISKRILLFSETFKTNAMHQTSSNIIIQTILAYIMYCIPESE